MTMRISVLSAAVAALMLAGCAKEAPQEETAIADAAPAAAEAAPEAAPQEPVAAPAPAAAFDLSTVPVSAAPTTEWPYVAAPEGYEFSSTRTLDLAQVPFWNGQSLQLVEGKVYEGRITTAGEKTWSRFEVLKRIDDSLTALGAHKVTTSEVPRAVLDEQLPKDFGVEFNTGAGGYYVGQEMSVYVLRTADRTVWFKVFGDTHGGSLLIAETEGVAAPAAAPAG